MPWSGGVFSRTNGVHTGSTVWEQDQAALTGITSPLHDVHDQDIASGINNCMAKDGTNAATAALNMGNFKLTNVANGSSAQDAVSFSQMNTAIAALIPSGTVMSFFQASAPTGWTQNVTYNDAILRVVSGTGGGAKTNGNALSSASCSGTVGSHSITQAELPNVNFTVTDSGHFHTAPGSTGAGGTPSASYTNSGNIGSTITTSTNTTGITVSSGGSGTAHTHTFTGASLSLNYCDMILASKN